MINSGRSGDHDGKHEQQQFRRQHQVTWRELAIREHRLAQLKRRAELIRDDGKALSFCASDHWYGKGTAEGLRDRLALLVGPQARPDDPILGTDCRPGRCEYDRARTPTALPELRLPSARSDAGWSSLAAAMSTLQYRRTQ